MPLKEIKFYETEAGKVPFQEWIDNLNDLPLLRKLNHRLHTLELGFMPDTKYLDGGVFETRIHTGGGVRIYFYPFQDKIIVLLCGGLKRTQKKDIVKAIEYATDFRRRYE